MSVLKMNKELVFNFTSHAAATKSLIYFPFVHILTWVSNKTRLITRTTAFGHFSRIFQKHILSKEYQRKGRLSIYAGKQCGNIVFNTQHIADREFIQALILAIYFQGQRGQ